VSPVGPPRDRNHRDVRIKTGERVFRLGNSAILGGFERLGGSREGGFDVASVIEATVWHPTDSAGWGDLIKHDRVVKRSARVELWGRIYAVFRRT